MLCAGAGFGLFQTPNNSTVIISSAPTQRSGGASGMLGMAPRLLGQTTGTTLVALLFSFVAHDRSTAVCLMVGSGFAVVAAIVSSLRLSQPSTLKKKIRTYIKSGELKINKLRLVPKADSPELGGVLQFIPVRRAIISKRAQCLHPSWMKRIWKEKKRC